MRVFQLGKGLLKGYNALCAEEFSFAGGVHFVEKFSRFVTGEVQTSFGGLVD